LKILPFLLVFFLNFNLFAQSKVKLKGVVLSNTSRKITNATIALVNEKDSLVVTSDSLGNFVADINIGLQEITIKQLGFVDFFSKINIQKDTLISFALEEDKSLKLKEVIVTAEKKTALTNLQTGKISFDPQKLALIPSISGATDIIKLLQLIPGVQNSGDANGYLYVRGGEPGHNLMLYTNTPVYGMTHLLGIFPFYNSDHIGEVVFDKSNSDPKHGGRLGSTVAVNTYKKPPQKFGIQGNVGLLASQITFSVPINQKTGFYFSARKTYIDEIVAPLFYSKKENANSDAKSLKYGFADGNFTYITAISEKNKFSVDAFVSQDKLRINDGRADVNAFLNWSNFTFSPSWSHVFSEKTSMINSFYFTRYNNQLNIIQSSVNLNISSFIQDFGFTNSLRFQLKNIPFEAGLHYTSHHLQPQKIDVTNTDQTNLGNTIENTKATTIATFISAKPKLFEKIDAELGLRLSYYRASNQPQEFVKLEPRFVMNYNPTKNNSFYVSYTNQNQFLNLITTSSVGIPTDFWIASSDGISPQSSNEFSLGGTQIITKQFNFSLNGFYRIMKNLIEYPYGVTQFNEITTLKNDLIFGTGKAKGLELMLKKDSGKLRGWISYTLSWSDRSFDKINNGNTFYAKYDRRHNLSIVATYDFNKKWSLGCTQVYSSGNRFTSPTSWYFVNNNPVKEYGGYNNAQLPNYIRTDVSLNYFFVKTPIKESALNFSVFNTFNILNPIYVVLRVGTDENRENLEIKTEKKILYSLLPSLSWRFKF
jgi:hypothetical protein